MEGGAGRTGFRQRLFSSYGFSLLLVLSVAVGAGLGLALGPDADRLKPLGDAFLNLLFTVVVPLVFFSIAAAIAGMSQLRRLGRIVGAMLLVFVTTGVIASLLMVLGVSLFPPWLGVHPAVAAPVAPERIDTLQQIVKTLTVEDFGLLLSRKSMLALILIAALVGLATATVGEKGKAFREFLVSGNEVLQRVVGYVMWYAPIGLCAYFAHIVGVLGPEVVGAYARAMALYYPLTLAYFAIGFTCYAWFAAGRDGVRAFWKNIPLPAMTAFSTGSSMAAIPSNLEAAGRIGVPRDIREVVIPVGATIHMDGSCFSAILKIALLFGLYGRDFSDPGTIATAVGVALLSGTVMAGIPGGGFIGEVVIVNLYGFPPEALPIISMIGTLVDPPATLVNATGDNVASMMVARIVDGRGWFRRRTSAAG